MDYFWPKTGRLHSVQAVIVTLIAVFFGATAFAQTAETQVNFGARDHDNNAPVEILADQLDVSEADGTAVFTGSVVIIQGRMRLSARKVIATYSEQNDAFETVLAQGDVIFVSDEDAAEADQAFYELTQEKVTLSGNVLLTRGRNALAGRKAHIDLKTGTAMMMGRVKTVILPASETKASESKN